MVVKKRLDYGFRGDRIPVIPRGPRSARRRGSRNKLVEDSQICAFELLAAVAGKLLLESESSASSNAEEGKDQLDIRRDGVKHEKFEEDKALRSECLDQGSCVESAFTPDSAVREQNSKSTLEEIPRSGNDTSSDFSKDVNLDLKLEICTKNDADVDLPNIAGGGSSNFGNLYDGKIKNGADRQVEDVKKQTGDLIAANNGSVKDPTDQFVNTNTLINSESSVQLPLYRDPVPSASFAKHRNNVKLGIIIDDDENSFGCKSTKIKAFRPQSRFGYRRIRKILTSKYWKAAPKLKDYEFSNSYEGVKPFYRDRKSLYTRKRCQREGPSKRRKICDRSFVIACDEDASSESISYSPEKGVEGINNSSAAFLHRASGPSASVKGLQKSKDANVKFSIKSFKVPELYIEVPETATVGALKRTVMEAVTAILGGGLRVGVVHQGKKVRDDYRTLQQAGISDSSNLENLGFTLEPSFNQVSPSVSPKKPPTLRPRDADQRLPRSPAGPNLELGLPISSTSDDRPVTKLEKTVEVSHELALSPRTPADAFTDEAVKDSKALVPAPAMNVEALAVVPVNQKPKRSELSQRRTRRPFSVGEVEALVEAVEKLGTGRWRDVKMRAFDNADHRTYVDLKDKWKTLVHTASISPQQRRGEPVPQELLDRVLSAHGYWSQHQSKQHGKHHVEALRITDGQVESVAA